MRNVGVEESGMTDSLAERSNWVHSADTGARTSRETPGIKGYHQFSQSY